MSRKKYKEPKIEEMETIINVLYSENIISIYTNNVKLQKKLNKLLGEPKREYILQNYISGSVWDILIDDKKSMDIIMNKTFELLYN